MYITRKKDKNFQKHKKKRRTKKSTNTLKKYKKKQRKQRGRNKLSIFGIQFWVLGAIKYVKVLVKKDLYIFLDLLRR